VGDISLCVAPYLLSLSPEEYVIRPSGLCTSLDRKKRDRSEGEAMWKRDAEINEESEEREGNLVER